MKSAGKINQQDFAQLFTGKLGRDRKEIVTGPAFGVDVSVVDIGNDQAMALTSDPLSLIPSLGLEESAWLSVHLMANDMATTGFSPMYGQFVLNLPTSISESDFETYWGYIHKFCKDIGLAITGGHTGSIEGQNSTIAGGGTFVTIAEKSKILTSDMAAEGDSLLVTKQCAMSASAILAMSFPQTVKSKAGTDVYQSACDLFYKTSSLQDGLIAAALNKKDRVVTAMHDVTEGGVLGGIYEMATASGNGVLIDDSKIPVKTTEKEICKLFSLDPRYCIGAGAMLITVKKGNEQEVIDALAAKDIACAHIGQMVAQENGMNIRDSRGETQPLVFMETDPYWDAFFTAFKNNWK